MMQVGVPMPADPNQVTTKPRQMPSGGGLPGGSDFNPDEIGGSIQEERADGNDTETDKEDSVDAQPPVDFQANAVRRITMMASEVLDTNPQIHPQAALDVACDAYLDVLRVEGYSYDPGAWTHDFQTSPSLLASDEVWDKFKDKAKRYWSGPRRPFKKKPDGKGEPLPPDEPDAPESREHDLPIDHTPADSKPKGYQTPATMGEFVRQQIDFYGQPAARDMWKMRHDDTPFDSGASDA